jgi:hypothetical protein
MATSIKNKLSFLVAAMALALSSGCSTLSDVKNAEGTGLKQNYNAGFDPSWKAARDSLSELKLDLASENKKEGYMLAQNGLGAFSYGENVAIFVRKISDAMTSIEVVSKKVMATNIFAPDWTKDIFTKIDSKIERAK